MTGLIQDLRFALRQLRKAPGFTAIAVFTLALGIGANTTVFSTVNAMMLRPFPFPHLDRIVTVWETINTYDHLSPAPANFHDWSEQSTQFDELAAVRGFDANLTGGNLAQHVEGTQVSSDFFSLLSMPTQLGRYIGPADFRGGVAPVAVISYGFWQQYLGADPSLVGKQLLLNGQSVTVIGGRIGAALSGFVFPLVQGQIGFVGAMWGLAGLSLLGGVLSQVLVPETSSRSLEEINPEPVLAG